MKTPKILAVLALNLLVSCVPVLGQPDHIAPDWGDPNDDILSLGQCNWGKEGWHTWPVPYSCQGHQGGDMYNGYYPCQGGCDAGPYLKIYWTSSVWEHYYVTPYARSCQSEVKTYAGYGTPKVSGIWCPDHSDALPTIDYYQPNPNAAYWENETARGVHWYVRGPLSGANSGTNYYYYGPSYYTVLLKCWRNSTNVHNWTVQGPNNWRVSGPECQ